VLAALIERTACAFDDERLGWADLAGPRLFVSISHESFPNR
jgi:hypothetical protein